MLTRVAPWLTILILVTPIRVPSAAAAEGGDTYPAKPIRLIVPFEAGSTSDVVARFLAPRLWERFKQEVAIENRSGEAGTVGTAFAAGAKPDGYTVCLGSMTTHVFAPLTRTIRYDPAQDFDPVTAVAIVPYVLALDPTFKAASLKGFITRAKRQSGRVSYSAGSDLVGYAAMEMLKSVSGATKVIRASQRNSLSVTDTAPTGSAQALVASTPAVLPHVKSGALKPIAVTAAARTPVLPDVPTVAESGYAGFAVVDWFALFVPRGTPAPIISRLHVEVTRGAPPTGTTSEMESSGIESRTSISNIRVLQRMRADTKKYSKVIKAVILEQEHAARPER